jgi:magnesium-protoporphyrin O-methyltransferase
VTCSGPCCGPHHNVFKDNEVRSELRNYRKKGPDPETRELVDVLAREGVEGATVVDIGAGVGAIGHGLVAAGAVRVTDVDGSPAYLAAARDEAERLGTADRWRFEEGDYVAMARDIGPADVITLGRVLCCYADWRGLVAASTAQAQRLYGLVYPASRWWVRLGTAIANPVVGLFTDRIRLYTHPDREVDAAIRSAGLERIHLQRGFFWQTVVYRRVAA